MGNVLGNKGQVVNQGRGSHQDVGVADEVTLPMKIGIDIGCPDNNVIGHLQQVALLTTLREAASCRAADLTFNPRRIS